MTTNRFITMFVLILSAIFMVTSGSGCSINKKSEVTMNKHINLYSWMRSGTSIHLAEIVQINYKPGPLAQEEVTLQLQIKETLSGKPLEPLYRYTFLRHTGELTRMKFPDPVWGLVELREKACLLLVIAESSPGTTEVIYAEEVQDPKDPILLSIRTVTAFEKAGLSGKERVSKYLQWLLEGSTIEKLFGAEALAKDNDLSEIDKMGQVAETFATVVESENDEYVRISLSQWMWDHVFPRTTSAGEVKIINAIIKGAENANENIRVFSIDRLATLSDPEKLKQPGVIKNLKAVRYLRAQLQDETSVEVREHLQKVIDALSG